MRRLIRHIITVVIFGNSFFCYSQEKVVVTPTKLSSSQSEYAPVYHKNGIVFSNISSNADPNKSMTGLYFVPFKKGKFGKKTVFSSALKSGLHEGAITFHPNGKVAYFTRSQTKFKQVGDSVNTQENKLGIYKTTFDGTSWGEITPCNFVTPEFSYGHPSLSFDGTRLYFSSDIEGGYGGKDIYYTEIKDGVCGPMINLGKEVNSEANEFFPSIDPNGNLYFSSDKEGGKGGLDLYVTKQKNDQWESPKNLEPPINTEFDDFSIVWDKNATEGYFASNRKGTDDIYKIVISSPDVEEQCVPMEAEQLCYDFFEEATVYVDSVEMIYEWDFGDGVKDNSLGVTHCYEKVGTYQIKLNILDKVIGEKYMEKASYELTIKEVIQPRIELPEVFKVNEEFFVTVEQGKWKQYEIEDYYIDFGDLTLAKNSLLGHTYDTPGQKEIKVIIRGLDKTTNTYKTNCFSKTIAVQ